MARLSPIATALGVTFCCAALGACGGDDETQPPPSESSALPAPAAVEPEPTAPPTPPAPDPAREVRLGAGFTPDPWVMDAELVGRVDAHTLDEACSGWLSTTPTMLFDADTAITELYLMAYAPDAELTLVSQGPDGSFRCVESTAGEGARLSGFFASGRHKVWVGVAREGLSERFRLGLSELSESTAASLETAVLAP